MDLFPKFISYDMECACPLGAPDCDCSTRIIPNYYGMELPPSPPPPEKKRKVVTFAPTPEKVSKQKTSSTVISSSFQSLPLSRMVAQIKVSGNSNYIDQMLENIKNAHCSNKEKEKKLAEFKALWNLK